MRISYRITSAAALAALGLPTVNDLLPPAPPGPRLVPPAGGGLGWDPCTLWPQLGPMYKLTATVWLVAYVVFVIQGLRNRSGRRWFAVAGALALVLWAQSDWWRVSAGCYGSRRLAAFFVWAGVVILMFVHHVIRRPHEVYSPGSPSSSALLLAPPLALACKCIWPALTFMPIAWSILNAFRPFNREPDFTERAIIAIQRCISWGTIGLALISVALCFGLFIIWARRSMVA
jgi:hypothetical protein